MAGDIKKQPGKKRRKPKKSRLGLWTILALIALVSAYAGVLELSRPHVGGSRLRFDTFVEMAEKGRIENAHILDEDAYVVGSYYPAPASSIDGEQTVASGQAGHGEHEESIFSLTDPSGARGRDLTRNGNPARYNAPLIRGTQGELVKLLLDSGVPITIDQQVGKRVAALASLLLPGLILVVLFVYLILSYRRGTGLFGIGSGARKINPEEVGVTFADVAGQDVAVAELKELKEFLSEPERFFALGAIVPKGVLLYGPPGCGKTLLAKALAGESGASFYSISGSDFVELYVGVGASRVRDLFEQARMNAPALIFIDELDSIGRARGTVGTVGSQGEQEQALNQILAEMDGFSPSGGIIVIGATNRPDILDQALLRPGRFDRTIGLERPDEGARLAILGLHADKKRMDPGVDLASVANRAIGLTGADLASLTNEAALLAARAGKEAITQAELEQALQQILEAPERQRRLSLRDRSVGRRVSARERVTFAEVAGVDDAVVELADVRDFLANPERYAEVGAKAPRGILLSGPPGCGKTLLARAVAGEANAAFISVAATEFVEVFVGEGASRVRELFAEASSVAPAIVFIDEIDAIGTRRGTGMDGASERDQTLNQILVELDGFQARTAVIVIAATNRPDMLDPALVRPGRFDRLIAIALPDRAGRRAILELHARTRPLSSGVDLDKVAGLTAGFSGADLANVLNEAAALAARRGLVATSMSLIEEAISRATLGVASRGTVLSDQERTVVAVHEAGHALVALALPEAPPPHRLTILAQGAALGHCTTIPAHDRILASRSMLMDEMATLVAGWVAEQLVFGEPNTSGADDLRRAVEIARGMVRDHGMSESLGAFAFPDPRGPGGRTYSEGSAQIVDTEEQRLVHEATERARSVLAPAQQALERLAGVLLEKETLGFEELEAVIGSEPAPHPEPAGGPAVISA